MFINWFDFECRHTVVSGARYVNWRNFERLGEFFSEVSGRKITGEMERILVEHVEASAMIPNRGTREQRQTFGFPQSCCVHPRFLGALNVHICHTVGQPHVLVLLQRLNLVFQTRAVNQG